MTCYFKPITLPALWYRALIVQTHTALRDILNFWNLKSRTSSPSAIISQIYYEHLPPQRNALCQTDDLLPEASHSTGCSEIKGKIVSL